MRIADIEKITKTSISKGLGTRDAHRRIAHNGPNTLKEVRRTSAIKEFIMQFTDFMILVLIASALISGYLGELTDAMTIIAIVLLNGILGFIQERKAERTMQALKELAAPTCHVKRDGRIQQVPAREVAVGDILVFEAGDRIAADARIIEAVSLEVEESTLTGESIPVKKRALDMLPPSSQLGDRRNMVYMGTRVTRGRGQGIVVATGMATEMGKIAGLIQSIRSEETPLQRRLSELGKHLVFICLALCAVIVLLGVLRGESLLPMLLAGVTLAVAAIPEGLPAIVTICLALGVERMARRKAIMRKLASVETLGCTTVICSDKTGTLTKNEMTVTEIYLPGREIQVTGTGYDPKGEFWEGGRVIDPIDDSHLRLLLEIGVRCNNAKLARDGIVIGPSWRGSGRKGAMRDNIRIRTRSHGKGTWSIIGDPTEGALVVAGAKAGLWQEELSLSQPWLHEIPFESERKRMTVIVKGKSGPIAFVKGAPDVLLRLSGSVLVSRPGSLPKVFPLTNDRKREIADACDRLARKGLRVLGFAYRELKGEIASFEDESLIETDLIFTGVMGMEDPPRDEVKRSITLASLAGISTVIITGDHEGTARNVAQSLGILSSGQRVVTGEVLDAMSDRALDTGVESISVFARVSPHHKLRIVKSLKRKGHIVAVTGDGVNDAPAVREADIGIAMGLSGTDVTREAASMVLADDNYATIVAAIEEGRAIYDNIRKFIRYLLGCNTGELLAMILGGILGLPIPLVPAQILWMNLVTDGLPAIALGLEPKDKTTMLRPPRDPEEGIFARGLGLKILTQGAFIGLSAIAVFILELFVTGGDLTRARTATFATLVFSQLLYVFYCRSDAYVPRDLSLTSNPYLIGAVMISVSMQLVVMYIPYLQKLFYTCPLEILDWIIIFIFSGWSGALTLVAQQIKRAVVRRFSMVRV